MDDLHAPFNRMVGPFREELKNDPSNERLRELELLVYDTLSHDPELRKVLLDTYHSKAPYLNFELVR